MNNERKIQIMNRLIKFYNELSIIDTIEVKEEMISLEKIFFSRIKINIRNEFAEAVNDINAKSEIGEKK